MYIEDNQVLLFEESEASNYEFQQDYDKPLDIKDYRNLYLDAYIHAQMKRYGLDPMQIQKQEDLDKLKENLLVIDQTQFKIYLYRLNITFVPGKGYIFQRIIPKALVEK